MPTLRLIACGPAAHRSGPTTALALLEPLLGAGHPLGALGPAEAAALLRDLAFAVADLAAARRERLVVPTEVCGTVTGQRGGPARAWEVGLERHRDSVLVSVFSQGPRPHIARVGEPLSLTKARRALIDAIVSHQQVHADARDGRESTPAGDGGDRGLALARAELQALRIVAPPPEARSSWADAEVSGPARGPLHFSARFALRYNSGTDLPEVRRADLHSLLFVGDLSVVAGECERTLGPVYLVPLTEQLVALADEMLEARRARRGLLRRVVVAGVGCGLQLDSDGHASLQLAVSGGPSWRLPVMSGTGLAHAVARFGRQLCRQVVLADRRQGANLRLAALRVALSELSQRLRSGGPPSSRLNGAPESYRAFAASDSHPPPAVVPRQPAVGKLRFRASWRADVPGIDLRSMHLCGQHLLVASSRQLACIERTAGGLVWSRQSRRAVSLMCPVGVVRLAADGSLVVHDIATGQPLFEQQLGACMGATTSGAVVAAPGLPHLLLVGEGAHGLAAVDLDCGEIRWRRSLRRHGPLRLRRAGKLMVAATGSRRLSAIDLVTGEVVWCHRGRKRYAHGVGVDRGELYALSSESPGQVGEVALEHIDPWTGALRWARPLPRAARPHGRLLVSSYAVVVVTREADGERIGVMAFDRATGELRFDLPGGLCRARAACLLVDDTLIANSASGELVSISLADGMTRYRQVFAAPGGYTSLAEPPRSLQPVLRSGALFVPQCEVYVIRPSDGALLGRLPADLVPDTLRIDERCGVYVGESSGYLAGYHALPGLTLVPRR